MHNTFNEYLIAGEWYSFVNLSLLKSIVESTGEFADIKAEIKRKKEMLNKFEKKISKQIESMVITRDDDCRNIRERLDFEKGWKLAENDKEFLLNYYFKCANILQDDCGGDGVEEIYEIINSIKNYGVEKAKDLIQTDAVCMAESVQWDVYKYYKGHEDVLTLIERSILA